tara:strand:+ start:3177 stop:3983 length:807 start_codon:yes stop_codon:yes gene_type:complete
MQTVEETPNKIERDSITTFDGVNHPRDEILPKMLDDDFYYGYLGKNALSSSSLKKILTSPKEYVKSLEERGPESAALIDGRLFHMNLLEPEKFKELNIVEVASKNTKIYKQAKEELGEVYTRKEIDKAISLCEILKKNKVAMEYLKDAQFEIPEMGMINGIPFRGKADIVKGDKIIDIKTTADIQNFYFSARKFGYDLQAALYLKLFEDAKEFIFVCIDKATHDIGIYECSDEFLGGGLRKLEQGISNYKFFFEEETDLEQYVIRDTL